MDSIPYDSIILLGTLLIVSAYFSALEASITIVSKTRARYQAENENAKTLRLLRITEGFDQSLSTVLIGKNMVNIILVVATTKLAIDYFGSQIGMLLLSTTILIISVLIFGEILPKSLAKKHAERYLLMMSLSLTIVMKLFYPITWFFDKFKKGINKLFGAQLDEPTVTEEDVKAMVQIGEEEGTFLTQEKELVHSALEFDEKLVNEILTPRTEVIAISLTSSKEEIKLTFIQEKYSRLPVYNDSIDNIEGTISYRDFFAAYVQQKEFNIREILRKPYFVIGAEKISNLFREMQKDKVHLAIVLDEYGGTAGIISMEDIIEEIVGEIWDEDEEDERDTFIELINEGKYRLDGRVSMEEISQSFNIALHQFYSNTLSGWISENLGYLPKQGEVMQYQHVTFVMEEVKNRRIQKVIVEMVDESASFTA